MSIENFLKSFSLKEHELLKVLKPGDTPRRSGKIKYTQNDLPGRALDALATSAKTGGVHKQIGRGLSEGMTGFRPGDKNVGVYGHSLDVPLGVLRHWDQDNLGIRGLRVKDSQTKSFLNEHGFDAEGNILRRIGNPSKRELNKRKILLVLAAAGGVGLGAMRFRKLLFGSNKLGPKDLNKLRTLLRRGR